jgi:methylenetetrahydrofolate dehydrogenase (NADP+)/methenyltetrahydrofolate cyclohydrolase
LLHAHATVTIVHSRTKEADLVDALRGADIVVAAVGIARFVRGAWLKEGAVVIDVGINRVDAGDGKTRLVGDVDFDEALPRVAAISPVPGGVGKMTIAMLMANTLQAAEQAAG